MNSEIDIKIERFPLQSAADLDRNIQHYYDLCALALMVADTPIDAVRLPGVTVDFAGSQVQDINHVRSELKIWILRSGMRDCLEALALYLNDVRNTLALAALYKSRPCKQKRFEREIARGNRAFAELSLQPKLDYLEKEYSVTIEQPDLRKSILELNWARNILVHNFGRPSEKDLDTTGKFRVTWHAQRLLFMGPEGRRYITGPPPHEGKPGEALATDIGVVEREFEKGESIIFTAQEFSEISFTFRLVALFMTQGCNQFLINCGYPAAPGSNREQVKQ